VQPKETTKPEGFDLETDRRIRERQANRSDNEEEQYEFHANPVPKNILERPVVCISVKRIRKKCKRSYTVRDSYE